MENSNMVIIAIGAATLIVGSTFSVYQLYKLVETDARCRGLKYPKAWGFFATCGNNQSGLILYFIKRRKHPILNITKEQKMIIDDCKKKFGIGLIFIILGSVMCVWGVFLL